MPGLREAVTVAAWCASVVAFAPPASVRTVLATPRLRSTHATTLHVLAEPLPEVFRERKVVPMQDDVYRDVQLSGLHGQALQDKSFPTKAEVTAAIPAHCMDISTRTSLLYTASSLLLTAACGAAGAALIPMSRTALPLWLLYAGITGTVAMGNWVLAHECGHGAFSKNRLLQDAVGFALHSALLVPYFSWQRSHAVHHAHTNHAHDGETHVPEKTSEFAWGGTLKIRNKLEDILGRRAGLAVFGSVQLALHLLIGWPAYILIGATGGRGLTNHFVPTSASLFPGKWKRKVWASAAGVAAMGAVLGAWAARVGWTRVAALYGGPYLVVNAWLIVYTWLQHTASDVPHFDSSSNGGFSFVKGAFHSIDRPYGKVIDFLHHRIGSTHVAHHLDCKIPHYHAREATDALQAAFPEQYLYDPTPVPVALWQVAKYCTAVEERGGKWVFVQRFAKKQQQQLAL